MKLKFKPLFLYFFPSPGLTEIEKIFREKEAERFVLTCQTSSREIVTSDLNSQWVKLLKESGQITNERFLSKEAVEFCREYIVKQLQNRLALRRNSQSTAIQYEQPKEGIDCGVC